MATKKDFEAIAAIVAKLPHDSYRAMMAVELVEYFKKNNPRFDEVKFLKACQR